MYFERWKYVKLPVQLYFVGRLLQIKKKVPGAKIYRNFTVSAVRSKYLAGLWPCFSKILLVFGRLGPPIYPQNFIGRLFTEVDFRQVLELKCLSDD